MIILAEPKGSRGSFLTLTLVVEISAFKMSGSYFVLDDDPENTNGGGKR